MSLKSGFYNAIETETGVFDRVYSADEYTNFYSAFLKDGVRRSGADDFKVTASGLVISAAAGYAICGSKWIHNDTTATVATATAPTGQYSRIDGVFLHVDVNESTRAASFVYRQGTPASNPQPPTKSESTGVYELCLAYIQIAPNATSVSVIDKRADAAVCGWVMSPVGYDDYFTQFDNEVNAWIAASENAFESWFANVRETLAVSTLFKQYTQTIVTTGASTTSAEITIVQYDPTGVDILQVYVNGMLLIAGTDYTTSGNVITFNHALNAGAQIYIVVYKSIDGTGLGSVSGEVTQLQTDVAALQEDVAEIQEVVAAIVAVEQKSSTSYQILGRQQVDRNFIVTKAGYTPVSIGNIRVNTDSSYLALSQFYLRKENGEDMATIGIINTSTSSQYVTEVTFTVMYQKTTT